MSVTISGHIQDFDIPWLGRMERYVTLTLMTFTLADQMTFV